MTLDILWMTALHFAMTALPLAAAALLAARLGVRSLPVLLATGMAASGGLALLTFWAYFADPMLGETLSYLIVLGAAGVVGWLLYERRLEAPLLRGLATPLALWGLGSLFVLAFGFVHGSEGVLGPVETAATRFAGGLPSDNYIPLFYAEWFFQNGHAQPVPVFGADWLSSDRPPLQVGYVLGQRAMDWDAHAVHYQMLSVILQQIWIVGLWALLLAARLGRTTRALVMVGVLLSAVVFANGFFVWPKLLPAGMLLAATALVATPLWSRMRRSYWGAILLAGLFAVAMMAHGSSVFGVIPLALIAAWRGLPSWRWIGVAALLVLAVQAPWSAYQKYHDPPGDRLVKWMIAGVDEVDDRGTREAIVDSYSEAGLDGVLHNKGQNFVTMVGGKPSLERFEHGVTAIGDGEWEVGIEDFRIVLFFGLLPSMGLLLLAPLAMAAGWRRRDERRLEWNFALLCFGILVVGALTWGLILFGNVPARTVMHAGSYALPILGVVGAVVGLRSVFPRFAIFWVLANAALMTAIYAPSFLPPEGTSYEPLVALIAAAALAGFGWLLLRGDAGPDDGLAEAAVTDTGARADVAVGSA